VEEWGRKLDLGRGGGEVLLEDHVSLVETALPGCRLLARNGKLPLHQVGRAVGVLHGAGDEAEWVVFTPLLALLRQSSLSDARHFVMFRSKFQIVFKQTSAKLEAGCLNSL